MASPSPLNYISYRISSPVKGRSSAVGSPVSLSQIRIRLPSPDSAIWPPSGLKVMMKSQP